MMDHAKILVTGGAGFIGSNLTERLLSLGYQVTVLDNFSTGKRENVAPFLGNPGFVLIEGDIRNAEDCRRAAAGADCIFHEAALGSVPRSIKDPATTAAVNILGFINVLNAAREANAKRVVYASSSSVYGDNAQLPKVEERTGRPLSPYAITKQTDELYAENFHRLYGLDTIGLRYFNVFGRRQDPAGAYAAVIPKFVISLLHHERPVINGDGSFSRDFTYIDNVVNANLLAMGTASPEAVNQVYNVACGERTTLQELFQYLRENLSAMDPGIAAIEPVFGPLRSGDIPHSLADIAKIRRLLGYVPEFSVKDGLRNASEWYYQHYGKENHHGRER